MNTEIILATDSESPGIRITVYQGEALRLNITLDETFSVLNGATFLFADLLPYIEQEDGPVLAQSFIASPTGRGPFEIDFSGQQMNQPLGGLPRKAFRLVIYASYPSQNPTVIYRCEFYITASGVPLMVPAPPEVDGLLTESHAAELYATLEQFEDLDTRLNAVEGLEFVTGAQLDQVTDDLHSETTARQSADTAFSASLSSLTSAVNTKASTAYVNNQIADAVLGFQSDLDDEVLGRTADVAALAGRLNALEHIPMDLISLSVSPNIVEVGATVTSLTFNWARNKVPATLSMNQGVGSITPSLLTLSPTVSITADTTYTLTANDGTAYSGNIDTISTSVSFQRRMYWGISAETTLNSAGILGLSNSSFVTGRSRSITLDGGGQYLYIAYPASFGDATFLMYGLSNTVQNATGIPITIQ